MTRAGDEQQPTSGSPFTKIGPGHLSRFISSKRTLSLARESQNLYFRSIPFTGNGSNNWLFTWQRIHRGACVCDRSMGRTRSFGMSQLMDAEAKQFGLQWYSSTDAHLEK